jgi:hypothetical protein
MGLRASAAEAVNTRIIKRIANLFIADSPKLHTGE